MACRIEGGPNRMQSQLNLGSGHLMLDHGGLCLLNACLGQFSTDSRILQNQIQLTRSRNSMSIWEMLEKLENKMKKINLI
jgi:hypothetical protein